MAKAKRKRREQVEIAEPTPEQMRHGSFSRLTMAYRRIPVIDTLVSTGKLSARQHHGLSRYRDIATAAERSPIKDSLDKVLQGPVGSNGGGGIMFTSSELRRLDSKLGALRHIAYAVAFEDKTVSQYAASKGGTTADGAPKRAWLQSCMAEIKAAGNKLAEAIGA